MKRYQSLFKESLSEDQVRSWMGKVRNDLIADGVDIDQSALDIANNLLHTHPELIEFFKNKGVADHVIPFALADYL